MRLLISCFSLFLLFAKEGMGFPVLSTVICDPIDFLFLVDTTTTTGQSNSYRYIKSFLKQVIVSHHSSPVPLDTRVVVIVTRESLYTEFKLRSYTSVHQAMRAVDLIRFNRWGRVADPYKTLSTYGFREESTKTVVVVTDGESRYCPRTSEAIRVVKRQGLKVFAIGVGYNTKRSVLESVASSPSYQFAFISRNFDSPRCVKIILAWTRPTCKVRRTIETTSLTYVYPKYKTVTLFRTSASASTFSKFTKRTKNNVFMTTKIPLKIYTSKPLTKVTSKGPRVNDTTSLTRVYPKYTTITPFRTSSIASTFEKITKSKNNVDESTTSYKLLSTTAFTEVASTDTTEDERNIFAIVTKSKVDKTTTSFETPSTTSLTKVASTVKTKVIETTSEDYLYVELN